MSDRAYPSRPILAVSVAIIRDGKVLLAARGRPPLVGVYSLPGGVVEAGETLAEAAFREAREEIGAGIALAGFVDHVEVIARDAEGRVERHFVIATFAARLVEGEPIASEEAVDLRWADPATLDHLPVTAGLPAIVARAFALVRS